MRTTLAVVSGALLIAPPLAAQSTYSSGSAFPAVAFGAAVAVSGNEVFVGRPGDFTLFPMPASQAGAVYAFRVSDGNASQPVEIRADAPLGSGFGEALAASGDLLAVGAPRFGEAAGRVYLFRREGNRWTAAGELTVPGGNAGDQFGQAVAIAGGQVLVGAPGANSARGAVHVFRPSGNAWLLGATLEGGATAAGDRFGAVIRSDGARVLVGAPGDNPAASLISPGAVAFRPGAAYVFAAQGSGWVEQARLAMPGDTVGSLGSALALSGGRVFAGAPTASGGGAVHVFAEGAGQWSHQGEIRLETPVPLFGLTLAMAGSDVIAGGPFASQYGNAWVLREDGGRWRAVQTLEVQVKGLAAFFGIALDASAELAVIAAPAADFFEGTAHLFLRGADGAWSERRMLADTDAGIAAVRGGQVECTDGQAGGFDCGEVDLVSFLPASALGAERGVLINDLWGWTDSTTGREYAIVGRIDGTAFVDITDAMNPVYLGDLPLTDGANRNIWRDMKVYANHVFIVADGAGEHGVQVFDLTRLRGVRTPQRFTEDAHYSGIHSAHNIVMNEETGFAFVVGANGGGNVCGGGLHIVDVRNPRNPVFAGCFSDPQTGNAGTGYTHDAQCVIYRGPDADWRNREICFSANETALSIGDVTDKANAAPISHAAYPNVGYAHQGWLSDDHRYFFLNDELDELQGKTERTRTLVWDIEDLDDPVLLTEYLGETGASDHNLYVRGNLMYESNYASGLRVIDISDPANPREVGYFDTVPEGENAAGFLGSWSNFPYFDSGVIIVSSMREGLFVLKRSDQRLVQ